MALLLQKKIIKAIIFLNVAGICPVFSHSDLDIHLAETENDLMTLSIMLKSPHSVELRLQMEDWVQSLKDLGKVDIQKKLRNKENKFATKCRNSMNTVFSFAFHFPFNINREAALFV